jgi:hypothetical protein
LFRQVDAHVIADHERNEFCVRDAGQGGAPTSTPSASASSTCPWVARKHPPAAQPDDLIRALVAGAPPLDAPPTKHGSPTSTAYAACRKNSSNTPRTG